MITQRRKDAKILRRTRKGLPRSLPAAEVAAMYRDYLELRSLEKAGVQWGRTRQSMFELFKSRGFQLYKKAFLPALMHKGEKFTAQKTGGRHRYLRSTTRHDQETVYLHHLIWEEQRGPIPPGHKVAFKDGNHLNCDIDNLELLTNSDQVRKYAAKGQNQFTVSARARLALLTGSFNEKRPLRAPGLRRAA